MCVGGGGGGEGRGCTNIFLNVTHVHVKMQMEKKIRQVDSNVVSFLNFAKDSCLQIRFRKIIFIVA